jgi:uncharacterized RDD family membrane protein YckC
MKCPKCQYIGFDGHTRCRHCGYDLSLSATTEMPLAEGAAPSDAAAEPLQDVVYRPESSARAQARAAIQKRAASRTPAPESFDLPLFATPGVDDRPALPASRPPLSVRRGADGPRGRAAAAAAFAPATPASASTASQEPMALGFADSPTPAAASGPASGESGTGPSDAGPRDAGPRDAELAFDAFAAAPVKEPDLDLSLTVGGTPLGGDVRAGGGALILPGREASGTASAGFARVRSGGTIGTDADTGPGHVTASEPATLRPDAAGSSQAFSGSHSDADADRSATAASVPAEPEGPAAPLGPRMLAGLVDLAVLAAVDAAIVFATLRATDVDVADVQRLPLAPLAVFLVVLAVGYLAMSTVLAGRTFGKAAFGLAVVETGGRPVRLAPAVVRALIQVLTVPAAGIGFLPALLGADRRSLYDRLAGTDVVRASRPTEDTRAQ